MMFTTCVSPGCGKKVPAEDAWVPEIRAIRQAEGGRTIVQDTLVNHVHCFACARYARNMGVKMFSFFGTVAELKRRAEESTRKREHFARYSLRDAFKKAGVVPWSSALEKK